MKRIRSRIARITTALPDKLPRVKRTRTRFVEPVSNTSDSFGVTELAEKGVDEVKTMVVAVVKSSRLKLALKWAALSGIAIIILFGLTLITLSFVIDDEDIESWIVDAVQVQTGGKLEIKQTTFSAAYGLTMHGVTYTPPARTDDRGFIHGGELESHALLTADQLVVHYSLPALLWATLRIDAVKLVQPKLTLHRYSDGSSIDGIDKYRKRHFPSVAPIQHEAETEPLTMSTLLPVVPGRVFLPFRVHIDGIGFEDLQFQSIDHSDSAQLETVTVGPLSSLSSLHWGGVTSKWETLVFSSRPTQFKLTGSQTKSVQITLNNKVAIEDFTKLKIELTNHLESLNFGAIALRNLESSVQLSAQFSPIYTHLKLNYLKVDALDALAYELKGDIHLPDDNLNRIRLNLKQTMKLDMFALAQTLEQVLPESELYGLVELTHFDIQGDLKPDELSLENLAIPYVNANIRLVDVKADLKRLGVLVAPVNGNLSLGAGSSLIGQGSQADAVIDLDLPFIKFASSVEGKVYQLDIKGLAAKLTTRVMFPQTALPIFKLDIEAEQLVAIADGIETVNVPMEVEVDLDARPGLSKASADARIELPMLLEAGIDADCRNGCKDLKLAADLDIRSLGKLFAIVQPILQRHMSLKNIPKRLAGGIASKLTLRGKVQDPAKIVVDALLNESDLNANMYVNVNDVDMALPGWGIDLKGFNNRVFLDGNLEQIKFIIKQDFAHLAVANPDLVKETVAIENFQFQTDIVSSASGPISLKNPAADMTTRMNTEVRLGSLTAPGYFPRAIHNPEFYLTAIQEKLRRITVEKLKVNVPDFGAELTGSLEAALGKQYHPLGFTSQFKIALEHGIGKALPSGVRSSGDAEFTLAASSETMTSIDVTGGASFEHFSVDIPDDQNPGQTLVRIEDMHGQIPIQQVIDLSNLQPAKSEQKQIRPEDTAFAEIAEDFFERNRDLLAERENRIVDLDYGSVRPFFPDKNPLTIKQIVFKTLTMKNMEFDVEIRQNWFALNQFIIQFLDGKIHGGMQFAFDPQPVALNATVHLTRLDTRKLIEGFPKLKKKSQSLSLFSDPYLDATMHIKYNIRNDEMDGGLDITSIGKEQLRMILFYIDPQQSNPTIAQIRTALNFGEVSQVSVPIRNGFIGLDVGLRLLTAPIPLPQLRGFPIAQVVKNFKDQPELEAPVPAEQETSAPEDIDEPEELKEVELDAAPVVH